MGQSENQSDKLGEAIGDTNKELSEQLVIEKGSICDKATECAINLKQMKDDICFAKAKEVDVNQKVGMSHIVEIQKQMNFIFVNKMNQQHNFF